MTATKILQIGLLLLCSSLQLFAYDYLYVQDPQFWDQDQGSIEEAQFTIHPRGIYMEVGMYLTLSAKSTHFERDKRNIEIVLGFQLPKNAIVTDSWLWINEDIIKADIMDRWTATNIYNDIVGRRQDPSLLVKHGNDQYELNVFPLQSDSTRRVKITYLVPGNWSEGAVDIPLPTGLLNSSRNPIPKIQIQSFLNNGFANPRISQLPNKSFITRTHATLGIHQSLELSATDLEQPLHFALDAPIKNGLFLSRYEGEEESFYQLALLPNTVFDLDKTHPKKVAVLVDYDFMEEGVSKETLLATIEAQLIAQLEDTDHFTIFLSQTDIQALHPTWLPADDETIKKYFDQIAASEISNFSHLPDLLIKGVEYIQAQETGGSLLVLSNASQLGEPEIANVVINELRDLIDQNIPIHIADYLGNNQGGFWLNGIYYTGNDYFYSNLARITAGSWVNIRTHQDLTTTFQLATTNLGNLQGILDIHTSLENGFCYGRYSPKTGSSFSTINQPFLQVGKYQGDFPFEIEASGVINDQLLGTTLSIPVEEAATGTTMDATIWAGNYIQELEQESNNNQSVSEIVAWSLANRVLSLYTAFLALEVEQGGVVCTTCIDETDLEIIGSVIEEPDRNNNENTDINLPPPAVDEISPEIDIADGAVGPTGPQGGGGSEGEPAITATTTLAIDTLVQILATPNPFHEQTTIRVQLSRGMDVQDIQFHLFDLQGRVIRSFPTPIATNEQKYSFTWDGTNAQGQAVTQGMYLFTVQTPLGNKHLKLIYLE